MRTVPERKGFTDMKISFRIAGDEVRHRSVAAELADMIKAHPECFDEIALFTDLNEHCYESLECTSQIW